jgi:hypothetical protein
MIEIFLILEIVEDSTRLEYILQDQTNIQTTKLAKGMQHRVDRTTMFIPIGFTDWQFCPSNVFKLCPMIVRVC